MNILLYHKCGAFFQTRVHSVLKQQKSKPTPQPPEMESSERFVYFFF